MEVTQSKQGNVLIVGLNGRLDANTSSDVQERLDETIAVGNKLIAIDFAALDYISSAGLRVILMILKKLNSEGGKLVVYSMKSYIKEVFEISGFAALIPVCETRDEALARLSGG